MVDDMEIIFEPLTKKTLNFTCFAAILIHLGNLTCGKAVLPE
jgi:hypothetical protein